MVLALSTAESVTSVFAIGLATVAGFALFSPRPLSETQLGVVFVLSAGIGTGSLWMLANHTGDDS
ncbi:hypothetical protein [Haloferax sp. YSSS75]|uniref:hypothetical protein n=1 Tax=Haloferax sp. YSSS75 TaxID=3388564 RepID=UPI00398CA700